MSEYTSIQRNYCKQTTALNKEFKGVRARWTDGIQVGLPSVRALVFRLHIQLLIRALIAEGI